MKLGVNEDLDKKTGNEETITPSRDRSQEKRNKEQITDKQKRMEDRRHSQANQGKKWNGKPP